MLLGPAPRSVPRRSDVALAASLFACLSAGLLAPAPARSEPGSGPVIGCTSLANLRSLLRQSEGKPVAMLAILADPRADLGCSPVDPGTVTAVTDHVNLNGNAYDCLGLKQTAICHWVVAGSLAPASRPAAPAEPVPQARKPKR